jgi:type I restriction enzyme S subunit
LTLVPLKEIAEIERDSVKPTAIASGEAYVGLDSIEGSGHIETVEVAENELASSKFRFSNEHILYGKLRPYLRKIARPEIAGICSTDILPIMPGPKVNKDYLFHFLRTPSMIRLAANRCTGANLPRLSPERLKEFLIPLPPLAEQKRIAAILDKADALRRKREQAIELTDQLLQSVFLDMFGDPVTNPMGWDVVTLAEVTTKVASGATPRGGKKSYQDTGIPLIRSMNVHDNIFSLKGLAHINDEQAQLLSNVEVQQNDILLNITGASVCRCAIVPPEIIPARVNQHVAIVRVDPNAILPQFLLHQLITPQYKRALLGIARGAGATREALTKEKIGGLKIVVPSKELQSKFFKVTNAINEVRSGQKQALLPDSRLRGSLENILFTSNPANI